MADTLPVVEARTSAVVISGTDVVPDKPPGIQQGELLVILAGNDNPGILASWPAKTDWNLLINGGSEQGGTENPQAKVALYWRWAPAKPDANLPETETVSYITGVDMWAEYLRISGADPDDPFTAFTELSNDEATNQLLAHTVLGILTGRSQVLGLGAISSTLDSLTFEWPEDWTEIAAPNADPGAPTGASGSIATKAIGPLDLEGITEADATVTSSALIGAVKIMVGVNGTKARSTPKLLDQLLKFLPGEYVAASDLLAGLARQENQIELDACDLHRLATVGGGTAKWLTLQGEGLGVRRATGELDPALRVRIRDIERRITPPALEDVSREIMGTETTDPVELVEWYEGPVLGYTTYLNVSGFALSGGPRSLLVLLPELTVAFTEAVYRSIARTLFRIRGALIEVALVLYGATGNLIPNRAPWQWFGLPRLAETGDVTPTDGTGFSGFSASDYVVVDTNTHPTEDLRIWAFKVRWNAAPTHNAPILGRSTANGLAVWVEPDGDVRVSFEAGAANRVDETATLALAPITVGVDYWVIVQLDLRALGETGEVGGGVFVALDGGTAIIASATWSASGTGTYTIADEHRLGRDEGLGVVSPGAVSSDELDVIEFREYHPRADTFTLDAATALGIADGSDPRDDWLFLRYDGSHDVVV